MQNSPRVAGQSPAGDPSSLEPLLRQHLPKLQAFIRHRCGASLRAKESVSDLAQSVCREVLLDLRTTEKLDGADILGWLLQQASRKLMDKARYYSRSKRDAAREVPLDATGTTAEEDRAITVCYATHCTPSRVAVAREQLARLESAIHDLPGNQGEAVLLTRIMHLTPAAAAVVLEVSAGAVRALVARGLAAVAIRMREGTLPEQG